MPIRSFQFAAYLVLSTLDTVTDIVLKENVEGFGESMDMVENFHVVRSDAMDVNSDYCDAV